MLEIMEKGALVHWQRDGKTHAEQFGKKLNDEQRMFVYRCHAEYLMGHEIKRMLTEHYGVVITVATITTICRAQKAKAHIEKFREAYMQKIKDVPIANKRIRMDDLEKARVKLGEMMSGNPCKTKGDKAEYRSCIKHLNETFCVALNEMERKPLMLQQMMVSDYSNLTDEELQERKREIIEKETGVRQRRDSGAGESGSGVEVEDKGKPAEVPMAAPEELRREQLQGSESAV